MKWFAVLLLAIVLLSFSVAFIPIILNIINPTYEFVSVDDLVASLDNLAKAEQNVRKETCLFGTVDSIGTKNFILKPVFFDMQFVIPMSKSDLIDLNKGEYIAIRAVVDDVQPDGFSFKKCRVVPLYEMDKYFNEFVSKASLSKLREKKSYLTIIDYVTKRGEKFKVDSDFYLKDLLLGRWEAFSITYFKAEFLRNGQCIELHDNGYSTVSSEYRWDVENCKLALRRTDSTNQKVEKVNPVYKVTENVIIVNNNTLYVRID